jgi:hypothetical protein
MPMKRLCGTVVPIARSYLVPPIRNGFATNVVMELIVRALERMKLKYPAPTVDISK